jgi:hypothetical protein
MITLRPARGDAPVGDYFLMFEMGDRAVLNREYRIPTRLEVGNGPYQARPGRPMPGPQ